MHQNYKEQIEQINRQIKELVGIYRDAVKSLDISDSEFWIWYTLVTKDGEHTQQDICSMWSLPKQTVNTIISRLRLKKYVYLEAVPGTRNHKVIRLTGAGRAYGEKLILPITRAEESALAKVSPEELSLVTAIFGDYIGVLKGAFDTTEKEGRRGKERSRSRKKQSRVEL